MIKPFIKWLNEEIKSEKIEIFKEKDELYIYKSNNTGGIDTINKIKLSDYLKDRLYLVKELKTKLNLNNTNDILKLFGEKNLNKIDLIIDIHGKIKDYNYD